MNYINWFYDLIWVVMLQIFQPIGLSSMFSMPTNAFDWCVRKTSTQFEKHLSTTFCKALHLSLPIGIYGWV